jgi:CheY-like chemotaxis protein
MRTTTEGVLTREGSALRILVVEDNSDCAESTATLLRMYGHRPKVVADGQTALQETRAQRPDVVLLDISLPGMNGWELAPRIKEEANGAKPFLIAVTGWAREEDQRHSAESGIDLHLVKPVDPELLRVILSGLALVRG